MVKGSRCRKRWYNDSLCMQVLFVFFYLYITCVTHSLQHFYEVVGHWAIVSVQLLSLFFASDAFVIIFSHSYFFLLFARNCVRLSVKPLMCMTGVHDGLACILLRHSCHFLLQCSNLICVWFQAYDCTVRWHHWNALWRASFIYSLSNSDLRF